MNSSPLQQAVDLLNGQSKLASAIGVKQAHVWYWLNKANGKVPAEYLIAIERATEGVVTRAHLRPDLYPPSDDPLPVASPTEAAA